LLKLAAFDAEDLGVLSAHLQDAIIRVRDIHFYRRSKRLTLFANRFAWEAAAASPVGDYQRRRSAVTFDRITNARSQRIVTGEPDGVLSLLSIVFEEAEPPSGILVLAFSGGGEIRLAAECVEARLDDIGAIWSTKNLPGHER
jgi:Protein of unknown function (DUF2948)